MSDVRTSNTNTDKARAAREKPAPVGSNINLEDYIHSTDEHNYQDDITRMPADTKKEMLDTGVSVDDISQRSGTFIQIDNSPIHYSSSQDGIEIMSMNTALEKYDWLNNYLWQTVAVDSDKYTAHIELNQSDGYFIRSMPGVKSIYPVQSCLYLSKSNLAQNVHNIVIAEEDSELHIITGCTTGSGEKPGIHLGVSEFYIKRGAKVTFTMIHNWNPEISVRPRTGIIIEKDGLFLSNYVIMKPVHSLQTNPTARCIGENATVRFNCILVSTPGSKMDVGSTVFLDAKGSRAELVSRAITTGGDLIARGCIYGNAPGVKGHLECRGLILKGNGIIHAIPELKGTLPGIDLSHEAAIGKIAEEEVEYLMARGLTHDEATATIVRGFIHVDIEGLPPMLNAELQRATEYSEQDFM